MKKTLILLILIVSAITAVAQQHVYPDRTNNYCLFPDAFVTASSTHAGFSAESAIDGDRIGQNCNFTNGLAPCWGNSGGWNDNTYMTFPDQLRVDFGRLRSIGRIVVVTFQDEFNIPRVEPYLGLRVGGNYGIEKYTLEVCTNCTGSVIQANANWVQVADVDENYDIIREHAFTPVLGTAIRLTVYEAPAFSRVIELEAHPK
jgi:hypothetical protein